MLRNTSNRFLYFLRRNLKSEFHFSKKSKKSYWQLGSLLSPKKASNNLIVKLKIKEYQFKKLYNLLDLNYSFYYHFSESESIVLISTILEYSPILRYCDLLYRILQMCLQYKFHQNKAHYKKRQLFHFYCFPLNLKNFFKKNF